jgi:hypothetical protein
MDFNFSNISFRQISVFIEMLRKSSLNNIEFIEKNYNDYAVNFIETLNLMEILNLVLINNSLIIPNDSLSNILSQFRLSIDRDHIIKNLLINKLLCSNHQLFEYIDKFLSHFNFENGQYEFLPNNAQRLSYSGIRNLFQELDILSISDDNEKYIIADSCFYIFAEIKEHSTLNEEELKSILIRKKQIGENAELEIIKYEKERLSSYPELVDQIEHISQKDVTVGYDIKSFSISITNLEKPLTRFIEVKAVSPLNYKFYWTKNEIDSANFLKNRYYLYLLPVKNKGRFYVKGLKKICDPYDQVYKNEMTWIKTLETCSFSLI